MESELEIRTHDPGYGTIAEVWSESGQLATFYPPNAGGHATLFRDALVKAATATDGDASKENPNA